MIISHGRKLKSAFLWSPICSRKEESGRRIRILQRLVQYRRYGPKHHRKHRKHREPKPYTVKQTDCYQNRINYY